MQRAFTLIEILLAVALIGLLSAGLVSTGSHLRGNKGKSTDEVFWAAVQAARRSALKSEKESLLRYDSKEKTFVITGEGTEQTLDLPPLKELSVDLLQGQSSGGAVLIGGQLVDTQTLPSVRFFPDGTCIPFRAQFRTTGPARIVAIDPWTCSAVLEAKKN